MADFRRVMTAFAVLVLLAGMANAQQILTCEASQSVPPDLRAEGMTELMGDIVLSCGIQGLGAPPPEGLINVTVFTPSNVTITSRVASGTSGLSEALLLVNEPAPGNQKVANVTDIDPPGCTGEDPSDCLANTFNTFRGVVAADSRSVTFNGVPLVPPATEGGRLVYRITNVRVDPRAIAVPGDAVDLVVRISISGSTSLVVEDTSFVTGVVRESMVFDGLVEDEDGYVFRQCEGVSAPEGALDYLRFRELFASAFKPQGNNEQNQPGFIYNTESGLTPNDGSAVNVGAVANWGTRLRLRFSNIPLGTSVYMSCGNIDTGDVEGPAVSAADGIALMHDGGENDSFSAACDAGDWVQVIDADDEQTSATVIYEVRGGELGENVGATIQEMFDFGIYFVAAPNPQASPAANVQGVVAGNYAPTPTPITDWDNARTTRIPRFVDPPNTVNLVRFTLCQTNLLFPYVLGGVAGFDTGIAITNTSTDPWDTTPQSGSCVLNFYGDNAPEPFTTPSIGLAETDQGAIWASTAMGLAQGFQGYIIAQCDFQYGHGFAFVSDIGAHDIAMGYLALVLPDVEAVGRPVNGISSLETAESLSN